MASSSESGHAMNVANFGTMITIVGEYGNAFNPARPELKLSALKSMLTAAQVALEKAKDQRAEYSNAVAARDEVFKPLKKFATKIIAAVKACDVSKSVLENMKSVNDKIQGRRSTSIKVSKSSSSTGETEEQKRSSTSQQSISRMIDHFEQFVAILSKEPKYMPNEPEMSVAGLKALIADMRAKNDMAISAEAKLQNAIISRDTTLYMNGTSVMALVTGVKNYAKSVFGGQSSQFVRLNKLKFSTKKVS
jgi:hypothetical protein